MAKFPEFIDGKKVVDYDDVSKEVSIPNTGVVTEILSFRTRTGMQGYIAGYAQAWDSAIDTFVTLHLEHNGVNKDPYQSTTVQLNPPEQMDLMPVPIAIEQNSKVRVTAELSGAGGAGNAVGRVVVLYVENNS